MRAHQHVRRDPPCKLSRHRRAALGTARVERGSGGGGGGAKDGEIGYPFESDDWSYLMSDAIIQMREAISQMREAISQMREAISQMREAISQMREVISHSRAMIGRT